MDWLGYIVGFSILVVLAYTVVPDLFLHRMGIGTWKRQYSSGVAITFDDGPDPEYTPKVLDILDRFNAPATFFVIGEKAAEYPSLIQEIQGRGHQLGVHCQQHAYAWFLTPSKTWQKWDEGVATLEHLTGEPVEFVRPPWGTFNLALWWWLKSRKKRAVLWNAEGHDWQFKRNPEQIAQRVLTKTREGSIVVLHDSGGEQGAPANTLLALETICHKVLDEQKLPLVKIDLLEWTIWRRASYAIWEKWERMFAHLYKVQRIGPNNLFRLSRDKYKGPNLYTEDGRLLAKTGDLVAEIHFDNVRLLSRESDSRRIVLQAVRQVKESLPGLASFVIDNSDYNNISVFLGLTLINRGVKGLGFQVQEVPTTALTRAVGHLQRIIMRVYHPTGGARSLTRLGNQPKLVWMSREQLLQRWLTQESL